jgi:hypothetical protein
MRAHPEETSALLKAELGKMVVGPALRFREGKEARHLGFTEA